MLFEFAYNEGRYEDALKLAREAVEREDTFVWRLRTCQLLFEMGFFKEANEMSIEISQIYPYDIARNDLLQLDLIQLYYCWINGDLDRIADRIAPINKFVVSIDGRKFQHTWSKSLFHHLKANLDVELGDFDEAEKSYTKALELAEKMNHDGLVANIMNSRGNLFLRQGRLIEALKEFEQAKGLADPLHGFDNISLITDGNIGIVSRYLNQPDTAISYLRSATAMENVNLRYSVINFRFHLFREYLDNGRFDDALEIYYKIQESSIHLSKTELHKLLSDSLYFQMYESGDNRGINAS